MLSSVPKLYVYDGPGAVARTVLERCTALKQAFTPTPWALNGHSQASGSAPIVVRLRLGASTI